ncbi:unnamed protein product [Mytilus coruscus]|uniref:Uncharacterized protein n=1 Tax=Mytilus coruscus TaxID=42192 RepID=A0A6J8CK36_MYTCO|nr:unnamed protein product [Mytilus coruscus]
MEECTGITTLHMSSIRNCFRKTEHSNSKSKIRRLIEQLSEKKVEVASLEKQLKRSEEIRRDVENRLSACQEELRSVKKDLEKSKSEQELCRQQMKSCQIKIKESETMIEDYKQNIEENKHHIEDKIQQIEANKEQIEAYKKQIEEYKKYIEEYKKQIKEYKKQIKEYKQQIKENKQQIDTLFQSQIQQDGSRLQVESQKAELPVNRQVDLVGRRSRVSRLLPTDKKETSQE